MAPAAPPELMLDVVDHILIRIPPDDPARLLRASLVCKPWRRLLTDPAFLRRYGAFHQNPPVLGFVRNSTFRLRDPVRQDCRVLGFVRNTDSYFTARFVPTSTFRPRDPVRQDCRVLDCRHGRVLLIDRWTGSLLVWDPITSEDHRLPINTEIGTNDYYNAAVLCAAADCDHLGCHGGPFLVVLAAIYVTIDRRLVCGASVYSSDADEWSPPTTIEINLFQHRLAQRPPVVAGHKVYFVCIFGSAIFCYNLRDGRGLSLIDGLKPTTMLTTVLFPTEDSGLRKASLEGSEIVLSSLETSDPDGVAAWTRCGVIHLNPEFTMTCSKGPMYLCGFASNTSVGNILFMSTTTGIFIVQLESHKIRKLEDEGRGHHLIFPFTSFVTPAGRGS